MGRRTADVDAQARCEACGGKEPRTNLVHELLGLLVTEVVPPEDDQAVVAARGVEVRRPRTDRHDEDLRIVQELTAEPERRSGDRRRARPARSACVEDDLDRRDHSWTDTVTQESEGAGRLDALRDGHNGARCELEPQDRRSSEDKHGRRGGQHNEGAAHDHTREPRPETALDVAPCPAPGKACSPHSVAP